MAKYGTAKRGPGSPRRTLYSGMASAAKKGADQVAYRAKKKKKKIKKPIKARSK